MPSADKRARKKENARAAREEREAAVKKKKRLKSMTTIGVIGAVFVGLIVILSVAGGDDKKETASTTPTDETTTTSAAAPAADPKIDPAKTYKATVTTNLGEFVVTLDAKDAPIGAGHFINLARKGVYDGSRWHRIIKNFVIQGGAPDGDLSKNYGRSVVGELPRGGKYKLGALAAAKTADDPPGTFDAQFYIVTGPDGEALPAEYADFGTVTSGMDVVKKIEALPTDEGDEPTSEATIDKIVITES